MPQEVSTYTVRTAFKLVELLAGSPDGLTVARLCSATGLPRSTVQRVLHALEGLDVVCRAERYHLRVQRQRHLSGVVH